ncbi:hypothetical protein MXB_3339 [Myxobolus squamalis]|nr:hypothetical protein MXB_3339 [Myxobolus squamalis]
MRGLPYATTEAEIREFFCGLEIVPNGVVVILDGEGRCSGDAYVEFSNVGCAQAALKKHREKIGNRFIEIFRSCKSEMSYVGEARPTPLMSINIKRRREPRDSPRSRRREEECEYYPPERHRREERLYRRSEPYVIIEKFIHMRGLPYGCVEEEIDDFFAPLPLVSVGFIYNQDGKFNGECDVYFESDSDVFRAMNKDKKRIGKRYVELFMRSKKTASRYKPREDCYYPSNYLEPPRKYPHMMMRTEPSSEYHQFNSGYHQSSISAVLDPYAKGEGAPEESCSPYMVPSITKHNQHDYYSSIEPNLIRSSNEFYDPISQDIPSTKESNKMAHNPKYIEKNSSVAYQPDDQFYPYN